jgi:hypothetical protein
VGEGEGGGAFGGEKASSGPLCMWEKFWQVRPVRTLGGIRPAQSIAVKESAVRQ